VDIPTQVIYCVGGVISPLLANIYLARLDRMLDAEGVSYVRYADDVRLASRTPAGARQALTWTAEVLERLGLRLNPQKTKLVSIAQGVDFLGYRLIRVKGHLNVYLTPAVVERCRAQVRQLTRRTAGVSLPVRVARLNEYLRGWGSTSSGHSVAGCWTGWTSGWRVGCEPTGRSTGAIPSGAGIRTSTCTAHLD
jgi:RNA-directed DNA polymerase